MSQTKVESALLDQVKQGDPVNFEIEKSGLGWIITNLYRK